MVKRTTVATNMNGRFTEVTDGMVVSDERQDSLTSCERQFQHDTETMIQQWQGVKSCESFNHTIKDTTKYRSEKQTTNFCSL
jgi:hypothetical protein